MSSVRPAPPTDKTAPPPYYEREVLRSFCWELLCHVLGAREASEKSQEIIPPVSGSPEQTGTHLLSRVVESLREFQAASTVEGRAESHKEIVRALDKILHPNAYNGYKQRTPRLNQESRRSNRPWKAYDGPRRGYSRDPFKTIEPAHQPEVALAATGYLVRAHSFFFFRPKLARSFNAAKVSLNDLFQATRLAVRLYYSLPCCHASSTFQSQQAYEGEVRQGPDLDSEPWCSPFFVWSLLTLGEIQRGNIYRQLGYLEEAHRHYRHVKVRYRRLTGNTLAVGRPQMVPLETAGVSSDHWFIHRTYLRTLSEHSKVLFDRGLFVESMMGQVQALALLTRMKERQPLQETTQKARWLADLAQGIEFLDIARKESTCDKGTIRGLFADGGPLQKLLIPSLLQDLRSLPDEDRSLAAGLYAQIALNLDIFHDRPQTAALADLDVRPGAPRNQPGFRETFQQLLSVSEQLDLGTVPTIVQDARSMLGDDGNPGDKLRESGESLERGLARTLRGAVSSRQPLGPPRGKKEFFESVLLVATHNIQNILTIPRRIHRFLLRPGYKDRRHSGDLSGTTVAESLDPPRSSDKGTRGNLRNKLVVLRRWQSFTPKIPRPEAFSARGGGYFLMWAGKGVVIDPGYDFLQNFYDEGFSLADIDAVLVTHSHPDHEDDLSTLTTLVREWNEYHELMGREDSEAVKLDLLLNESAHLKFSGWLKASGFGVGRIVSLPLVVWDLDSDAPDQRPRGDNVLISLRGRYRFDLEVVPAWHDDVLGKTAAVGVNFHLFDPEDPSPRKAKRVGVVGYTGDTAAYSYPEADETRDELVGVEAHYQRCDVVVAHLGDVRLRELFTCIEQDEGDPQLGRLVGQLLKQTFCGQDGHIDKGRVTPEAVEDFYSLLVTLHLAPGRALEARLETDWGHSVTVAEALHSFIRGEPLTLRDFGAIGTAEAKLSKLGQSFGLAIIGSEAGSHVQEAGAASAPPNEPLSAEGVAYALLGFLCATSLGRWRYGYHLGIDGLYQLQQALAATPSETRTGTDSHHHKVLVVGELPEELASHRHHVTRLLNYTEGNFQDGKRKVHAFTGDIGLHIGLDIDGTTGWLAPTIRCAYCNHNNETVLPPASNYHPPHKILETPLKRLDSAMIYLCTEHDHHPENEARPRHFLNRPVLRVI